MGLLRKVKKENKRKKERKKKKQQREKQQNPNIGYACVLFS